MVWYTDQEEFQSNGHNGHHTLNGYNGHDSIVELPKKEIDYAKLLLLGRELLVALGENPDREGLQDTPRRWADWWREFAEYDPGKTETTFSSASTGQFVCVSGMRVWSLCVPGKQIVNGVSGDKRACDVRAGDKLWTVYSGRRKETTVTAISSHQTRDVVEVITRKGKFKVTADHPLATPQGWIEAKDVAGTQVEWTPPRSLCRNRYEPKQECAFDSEANVEGDGFKRKNRNASVIVGANIPCSQSVAQLVGATFTARTTQPASQLYISDHWYQKHGFQQKDHQTTLLESEWVDVLEVRDCSQTQKPYTVYSFTCEPYSTFLVNGHLTHNCEHHLMPFYCDVSIGYITGDRVLGLSKFARIAHQFAHQLQIQERLGQQIADEVCRLVGTEDVAVLLKGEHLCMTARGIRTPGIMTSSIMRGVFQQDYEKRMEFLTLVKQ